MEAVAKIERLAAKANIRLQPARIVFGKASAGKKKGTLDSGATNALRERNEKDDCENVNGFGLTQVEVELAIGSPIILQINGGATVLGPKGTDPLMPMAGLSEIGCNIQWPSGGDCQVWRPSRGWLEVEMVDGTPQVDVELCLGLIEELESVKRVAALQTRVAQTLAAMGVAMPDSDEEEEQSSEGEPPKLVSESGSEASQASPLKDVESEGEDDDEDDGGQNDEDKWSDSGSSAGSSQDEVLTLHAEKVKDPVSVTYDEARQSQIEEMVVRTVVDDCKVEEKLAKMAVEVVKSNLGHKTLYNLCKASAEKDQPATTLAKVKWMIAVAKASSAKMKQFAKADLARKRKDEKRPGAITVGQLKEALARVPGFSFPRSSRRGWCQKRSSRMWVSSEKDKRC